MTLFPDTEALKKSSFLGAVEIFFFFGTWRLFKKDSMDCSTNPDG